MLHGILGTGMLCRRGLTLLRLALGALFLWTALTKLQHAYDFLGAVYNYELLGRRTGLWVASVLPWLELSVGVSLVLGVWLQGGALLAVLLSGVFTLAQASAAGEGLKIPCGCAAGNTPTYTSYWTVAESAGLFAAACLVFAGSVMLTSSRAWTRANGSGNVPSGGENSPSGVP
jgi:putative oxidoreductase